MESSKLCCRGLVLNFLVGPCSPGLCLWLTAAHRGSPWLQGPCSRVNGLAPVDFSECGSRRGFWRSWCCLAIPSNSILPFVSRCTATVGPRPSCDFSSLLLHLFFSADTDCYCPRRCIPALDPISQPHTHVLSDPLPLPCPWPGLSLNPRPEPRAALTRTRPQWRRRRPAPTRTRTQASSCLLMASG